MLSASNTQARQPVKFAVSALTMAICMAMLTVSPARADDLDIYQPAQTGGGSTLVLMLDGAGDMNSQGKLDDLISGLKIFLATDDPTVNKTSLGLGHYNNFHDPSGTGTSADIIVPAATLGSVVNSTTSFTYRDSNNTLITLYEPAITTPRSQRRLLWDYVIATSKNTGAPTSDGYAFDGNSTTNPMQGFAEAASYLLGTTTTGAANSGFASSISTSKNGSIYRTPLTTDSGTCAGVGIYFLTAGGFQEKTVADGQDIFSKALSTPTTPAAFTCPALGTTPFIDQGSAPWSCMGKFAQTLFSGTSPAAAPLNNVQIRTAFVGFGSNFSALSDSDAKDVCHIGSKLKGDQCSPDSTTNTNPSSGYGNGGYYAVTNPTTVTASIKNFILTLGGNTVTPLVTGAASIPIDDLNPNGFQNYGYLRMIAPNPGQPSKMLWRGDLKKYALSSGAMVTNGGTKTASNCTATAPLPCVLNNLGQLVVGTTDNWNAYAGGSADGGIIDQGGAYPVVPMPTTADQNKIRPLFTDLGSVSSVAGVLDTITGVTPDKTTTLSSLSNCTAANYATQSCLGLTPVKPLSGSPLVLATDLHNTIPQMFDASNTTVNNGSPLKDLSIVQKKKLINYLGFNTPIYGPDNKPMVHERQPYPQYIPSSTIVTYKDPDTVPTDLTASPQPALPSTAYLAMGGSVHAQPIQFSYLSDISSTGVITNRKESVLYGTMEGALHLVNASSGVEQMAFIPAEILADDIASRALRVDEENKSSTNVSDLSAPAQGVDGPWVADPAYRTTKGTSTTTGGVTTTTSSTLNATRMNVYGGLRMGGNSYYGLDLLDVNQTTNVAKPKLLFRVGPDVTGFARLGKSFSKPVLANVRYNNVITRVMIVGGGYDNSSGSDNKGYENPAYVPTTTTPAKGNAVYMVDAKTGALIWEATAASQTLPSGAVQTVNANMIHSIPARVSAIDRDGDQLVDSIYFADIGGQLFRADFNNKYGTSTANFAARVTRLANLGTDSTGTAITNGTNPRFFEAPTVTVYDKGTATFGLVTLAGGNRSAPLDVLSVVDGGKGLNTSTSPAPTPTPPLPVNNVYGIIDRDLARPDLIKLVGSTYMNANGVTAYTPNTANLTLSSLQKDPQTTLSGTIADAFFTPSASSGCNPTTPASSRVCDGWYRSLSSMSNGTELSGSSYRYSNGKPMYAGGLKAYEEQIALTGKLYVPVYDPQGTGVTGGVCQARVVGETDLQTYCLPYGVCLTSSGTKDTSTSGEATSGARFLISGTTMTNDKVIGPGIRGISLGDNGTAASGANACKGFTIVGNLGGTGNWNCTKKLIPTLWYEKQPNRSKVQ